MSWIRPRDHNLFVNIGSLLLCGVVAGVLVAAALIPGVTLTGLAVKESAEQFDQLPTELTHADGPQISYVYARDGETRIAAMYDENRRNVPLHDISPLLIDAVLSAEDRNFYEHNGVDTRGILRAFVANVSADTITQGASTVTQQYVRLSLTYFSDNLQDVIDATEETTARKLREARYAIAVEQQMSKDEILNRYLNLAYFGEGAYGVFAASQVYFGKRPSDLDLAEAAFLAGLIQAPSDYTPTTDAGRRAAFDRRNWVLDQMVDNEVITAAEAADAKAVELDIEPRRQPNMCVGVATNHWGFFCDYFYRWWLDQEAFGATKWERELRLRSGGFRIVTTLDPDLQAAARAHVEEQLRTGHRHALMIAALEPATGKVRALATNRNFALDDPTDPQNGRHSDPALRRLGLRGSYPNTTNPLVTGGGDIHGYQAGSTFKLFTMIAALENGYPLGYRINSPRQVTTGFYAEPGTGAACGDRWCPVNYPGQRPGRYDMWTALGSSINTYFAQLIDRVGSDKAVDVAKRMGIQFRASGTEEHPQDAQYASESRSWGWGPFTLGVSATTPLDLANAYGTLATEGIHCDPIPVEEIVTMAGERLDLTRPSCDRVLSRQVSRAAIDAGRCVVGAGSKLNGCSPGGGTAPEAAGVVGHPVFGKTGTSDGTRTYTTVLSTSELTVAGQIADPDWAQTNREMPTRPVRTAVAQTLRDGMRGLTGSDWAVPTDPELIRGSEVAVPDVTCDPVPAAIATLEEAGFEVEVDPRPVDSDCAAGLVAETDPSGTATPGETITIRISNGSGHDDDDDDEEDDPPGRGPGPPGLPSPPEPPGDE